VDDLDIDELLSPIQTVLRINEYRRAGRIALIEPFLLPEQSMAVLRLIRAVERLERANEVLQAEVRRRFGRASAGQFDYDQIANIIGVFSKDLTAIDEHIDGDTASVAVQVAGRLPLEEVELVRRGGRWLVRTDPPIGGLDSELGKLAEVWIDISRWLKTHQLTSEELRRELNAREAPIARRLKVLTQQNPP
jgi:hypothetical protein